MRALFRERKQDWQLVNKSFNCKVVHDNFSKILATAGITDIGHNARYCQKIKLHIVCYILVTYTLNKNLPRQKVKLVKLHMDDIILRIGSVIS